jgi:hypothetical protein
MDRIIREAIEVEHLPYNIRFLQEPHGLISQKTPFIIVAQFHAEANLSKGTQPMFEECRPLGCYAVWLF